MYIQLVAAIKLRGWVDDLHDIVLFKVSSDIEGSLCSSAHATPPSGCSSGGGEGVVNALTKEHEMEVEVLEGGQWSNHSHTFYFYCSLRSPCFCFSI